MFDAWGRFVYRHRWATLGVSLVVLVVSAAGVLTGGELAGGSSVNSGVEAARASRLIATELAPAGTKPGATAVGSTFLLIYSSRTEHAADAAFRNAVDLSLAPVGRATDVIAVHKPEDAPAAAQAALTSKDGHEEVVQVDLSSKGKPAETDYVNIRKTITSPSLTITGTGLGPINAAFTATLGKDLQRAELISLPVTLLLLLIIFGTIAAAGLPLGIGVLSIVGGLGGTLFLTHFTTVSPYALNIVTLVGLGVSIDYSLIVVTRFRDELTRCDTTEAALGRTIATAGRAMSFSGLTVAAGLSAMLFYQGTFLASMGAAGGIVVGAAVLYGLTALPALLAILGPRVNRLRVPIGGRAREAHERGVWHGIAIRVMRHPLLVLLPTVALLLLMGSPFLHLRLANGGTDLLPPSDESRRGFDDLLAHFPGHDQTQFDVVVHYTDGSSPSSAVRVGDQYDLSRRIAAIPGVLRVDGIFNAIPGFSRSDYQSAYAQGAPGLSPAKQPAFRQEVGRDVMHLTAVTSADPAADSARTILASIRTQQIRGAEILVTGETAIDVDTVNYILRQTPIAVGTVILITCIVLFLMTGSVVLPVKAVLLNLLSISASFGALVWVFQDGHLSRLLNFTPQWTDPSIPVIMFAIVFGMSMDYEVLLLSRIQEEYQRTGDTTRSVAEGLERSGRLITGAAAIMVGVFLAFGLAEVVIIKAIGLGLALAIALDATIVRALIVPASMRLLGRHNWWAPAPLARLYRRAGLAENLAPDAPLSGN